VSENKDAQAVQKAQAAAVARGAEADKSREEAEKLQAEAAERGGGDAVTAPYESYDFMPLSELQKLADERGVTINPDVLKAHLITELRAHQSGVPSAASRLGAR
jgi:hypothetical protein